MRSPGHEASYASAVDDVRVPQSATAVAAQLAGPLSRFADDGFGPARRAARRISSIGIGRWAGDWACMIVGAS